MKKFLVYLLAIVLITSFVSAADYKYIVNSYTTRQDAVHTDSAIRKAVNISGATYLFTGTGSGGGNSSLQIRNAVNVTDAAYNFIAKNITGHIGDALIDSLDWSKLLSVPKLGNSTQEILSVINTTSTYQFSTTGTAVATSDSAWTSHNSYPVACSGGSFVTTIGDTNTCATGGNTTREILDVVNTTSTYQFSTTGTAVATSDSTWTLHNSYPVACTGIQFVQAIGDTLTCGTPTDTFNSTQQIVEAINKTTGTFSLANVNISANLTSLQITVFNDTGTKNWISRQYYNGSCMIIEMNWGAKDVWCP